MELFFHGICECLNIPKYCGTRSCDALYCSVACWEAVIFSDVVRSESRCIINKKSNGKALSVFVVRPFNLLFPSHRKAGSRLVYFKNSVKSLENMVILF